MKTVAVLLCTMPLLMSCASRGMPVTSACGDDYSGHKETKLDYEEDDISMKWKTKAKRKSEFWIKLSPTPDYQDKLVTIVGVDGRLPDGTFTSPNWLNTDGRWTTQPNKRFVLCIPDVAAETEYKFDVIIEDIGTLDPRLEVTH